MTSIGSYWRSVIAIVPLRGGNCARRRLVAFVRFSLRAMHSEIHLDSFLLVSYGTCNMQSMLLNIIEKPVHEWSGGEFLGCCVALAIVSHHFLVQYPYQAEIFTTLWVFLTEELCFMTLLYALRGVIMPISLLENLGLFFILHVSLFRSSAQTRYLEFSSSNCFTTFCVTGEFRVISCTGRAIGLFAATIKQEMPICESKSCTKNMVFLLVS